MGRFEDSCGSTSVAPAKRPLDENISGHQPMEHVSRCYLADAEQPSDGGCVEDGMFGESFHDLVIHRPGPNVGYLL